MQCHVWYTHNESQHTRCTVDCLLQIKLGRRKNTSVEARYVRMWVSNIFRPADKINAHVNSHSGQSCVLLMERVEERKYCWRNEVRALGLWNSRPVGNDSQNAQISRFSCSRWLIIIATYQLHTVDCVVSFHIIFTWISHTIHSLSQYFFTI